MKIHLNIIFPSMPGSSKVQIDTDIDIFTYIHTYIYTFHRSLRVTRQQDVEHVINIQTIKILQCKIHLHSHTVSNTYHLYMWKVRPQSKISVHLRTFSGLL
jgi:hypothetical protein